MTEEPPHRPAPPVNGSKDRREDPPRRDPEPEPEPSGGRLKFFKDGKFILELARGRARDGERPAWVAVPRKSPRPGAPHQQGPGQGARRSERAASLSVSDDNSSIQSSPWQRDHCWKQATPQRGLSKELAGCYVRPAELPATLLTTATARRKRRRPFDPTAVGPPNGVGGHPNGAEGHSDGPAGSPRRGDDRAVGKFKFFKQNAKEHVTLKVYRKSKRSKRRKKLCNIIGMLADRLPAAPTLTVNAKTSNLNFKQEHAMVSPRKRILRELERVSLGLDDVDGKKSRPRESAPKAGPSHDASPAPNASGPSNHFNGIPRKTPRREPTSRPVSNYSINSLLSKSEDSAPRRSPEAYAKKTPNPSYNPTPHKTDSPPGAPSPDLSLSSSPDESRRPRQPHPVPHFNSPGGHSGPSSASPRPPEKYFYHEVYPTVEDQLQYQLYPPAPYLPHAAYLGATYPPYSPHGPPPLWMPCPVLPGPWAPLAHPLLTDHSPREEASSDLPLNLSKH